MSAHPLLVYLRQVLKPSQPSGGHPPAPESAFTHSVFGTMSTTYRSLNLDADALCAAFGLEGFVDDVRIAAVNLRFKVPAPGQIQLTATLVARNLHLGRKEELLAETHAMPFEDGMAFDEDLLQPALNELYQQVKLRAKDGDPLTPPSSVMDYRFLLCAMEPQFPAE